MRDGVAADCVTASCRRLRTARRQRSARCKRPRIRSVLLSIEVALMRDLATHPHAHRIALLEVPLMLVRLALDSRQVVELVGLGKALAECLVGSLLRAL
jgi:hypothetical protein